MIWLCSIFTVIVSFSQVVADNNDVVVFVHGLADDESTWEYEAEVLQSGLRTITVNLSPFESRYDRAIGLYAQLKGLQTDYGVCHSRKYNHLQFGEDFTGRALYPEWDENHKVHFIGHSLGGMTITTLERLLEIGNDCDEDTGSLFQGGKSWITSITTLGTPHDGTTAPDQVPFDADELAYNLLVRFGSNPAQLTFPQFELYPEEGESNRQYFNRLKESNLFTQDDFSFFDLSVAAAEKYNSEGPAVANPNTYYFAYALDRTSPSEDCFLWFFSCEPVEDPDFGMSLLLQVPAQIIGAQSAPEDRPNDGIVNKQRARCPNEDKSECIQVADDVASWAPGQWHWVDVGYLDHFQITARDNRNDQNNFDKSAKRIYMQTGLRLKNLPSTSVRTLSLEEEQQKRNMADDVALYLEAMDALSFSYEKPNKGISTGGAIVLALFIIGSVFAVGYSMRKKTNIFSSMSGSIISAYSGTTSAKEQAISV